MFSFSNLSYLSSRCRIFIVHKTLFKHVHLSLIGVIVASMSMTEIMQHLVHNRSCSAEITVDSFVRRVEVVSIEFYSELSNRGECRSESDARHTSDRSLRLRLCLFIDGINVNDRKSIVFAQTFQTRELKAKEIVNACIDLLVSGETNVNPTSNVE